MFERLAVGRPRFIYVQFVQGVLEVLGVDRRSREGLDFILTYMAGKRLGDYPK